jgi:hypothetical protein
VKMFYTQKKMGFMFDVHSFFAMFILIFSIK